MNNFFLLYKFNFITIIYYNYNYIKEFYKLSINFYVSFHRMKNQIRVLELSAEKKSNRPTLIYHDRNLFTEKSRAFIKYAV